MLDAQVRMAACATAAVLLEGAPQRAFLAIAECRPGPKAPVRYRRSQSPDHQHSDHARDKASASVADDALPTSRECNPWTSIGSAIEKSLQVK